MPVMRPLPFVRPYWLLFWTVFLWALSPGSWGSTALLVLASFVVYRYRIAVEERALLAIVGEPYRQYIRTRRRLIPFVY